MILRAAMTATAAENATYAFTLPAGSADAAPVMTLPPGNYSAAVSSATSAAGTVLVEVYEVPQAPRHLNLDSAPVRIRLLAESVEPEIASNCCFKLRH